MKSWNFSRFLPLIISACFILAALPPGLAAQTKAPEKPLISEDKIRVTADSLITNAEANYAEFTGNVKASQGEAYILAKRLRIYYNPNTDGKGGKTGTSNAITGTEAIEKVVASGNVRMRMDNREALTERAEYIIKTEILTLNGKNTKISEGKNFIVAEEITFFRKEGRVKAERNVAIEVRPSSKGIQ